MTKEQMEEAVSEARELIALVKTGALEPDSREGVETTLRRILKYREAWLRGEIIVLTTLAERSESEIEKAVKSQLQSVVEGAQMLTKPEVIEWLRSTRSMNHEPLRKIEKEWLDRVFVRERISKGWLGLALQS